MSKNSKDTLAAVLRLFSQPGFETSDDTWIHRVNDLCLRETESEATAREFINDDRFDALLDLLVVASATGGGCVIDPTNCFNGRVFRIATRSSLRPRVHGTRVAFASSVLFSLYRHVNLFHDLRTKFHVILAKDARVDVVKFVDSIVENCWYKEASVRSAVFASLLRLTPLPHTYEWMGINFFSRATFHACERNLFASRDALNFVTAFLRKEFRIGNLDRLMKKIKASPYIVRTSSFSVCLLKLLYECDSKQNIGIISEAIEQCLQMNFFEEKTRNEAELALRLCRRGDDDAFGSFLARNVQAFREWSSSFSKCTISLQPSSISSAFPVFFLLPLKRMCLNLRPEISEETLNRYTDKFGCENWKEAIKTCETLNRIVEKGLWATEESLDLRFVEELLVTALGSEKMGETEINRRALGLWRKTLLCLVRSILLHRPRVIPDCRLRPIFESLDAHLRDSKPSCCELKASLLLMHQVIIRKQTSGCDENKGIVPGSEFNLDRLITTLKNILAKDESWEISDTVVEFFKSLGDFLYDEAARDVSTSLIERIFATDDVVPWLFSIGLSASKFRGPSSSYVRASAVAALPGPLRIASKLALGAECDGERLLPLVSMDMETEAVVRRSAVASLTRLIEFHYFQSANFIRVSESIARVSQNDLDWEVRRRCIDFWTAVMIEKNYIDVESSADPVGLLVLMAVEDVDVSVKDYALEKLKHLSSRLDLGQRLEINRIPTSKAELPEELILDDILNYGNRVSKTLISFTDVDWGQADCY